MSDYRDNGQRTPTSENAQNPANGSTRSAHFRMGVVTNAPFVKVRKEPSPEAETITNKQKGERVKVWAESGDYYKITAYGDAMGYMMKKYIQLDPLQQ